MYVNNPHVKKRQFTGNLHPNDMGNGEYADYDKKETEADYETVPYLVTPDNPNDESSKAPFR